MRELKAVSVIPLDTYVLIPLIDGMSGRVVQIQIEGRGQVLYQVRYFLGGKAEFAYFSADELEEDKRYPSPMEVAL